MVWDVVAPPLTVVGFPLTLLGVLLTMHQAIRSRAAAEQARDASRLTTGRMMEMRLHVQVGHLERLIEMLNAAQTTNNHQMARSTISLWDSAAATLVGVIKGTSLYSDEFRTLVRESRLQGNIALIALGDEARSVAQAVRELRKTTQEVAALALEISSSRFAEDELPEIGASSG